MRYGQVLYIDSSPFDITFAPDLINHFPATSGVFYIGIDGATHDSMAHAVIYGSARTDGLALLIREHVRRHGFLPRTIHVDRGAENTSDWLKSFCDMRISLRHSPTAGSAWNGIAENTIKQINSCVAHALPGSKWNDQLGRKVDGRFKSIHHARMSFAEVLEEFSTYVYEDLPNTPRAGGRSPREMREELLKKSRHGGIDCVWGDDILIQTSIKPRTWTCDRRRGIRIGEARYTSRELIDGLKLDCVSEVRTDVCDPTVAYAKLNKTWVKVFHASVIEKVHLTQSEKLFDLLSKPELHREARLRKRDLARKRYSRHQLAIASLPSTQHLGPAQLVADEGHEETQSGRGPDFTEVLPFEEGEDF